MQHLSILLVLVSLFGKADASLLRAKNGVVPKQDMEMEAPVESVGDILPDEKPPNPKGQEYNHMYAPQSPPHRQDMSPTDPIEYLDAYKGDLADWLHHVSDKQGRIFEGSTCKSTCAACAIYAAQQDQGMCECYTTCKMGDCGAGSGAMPHIGWSNNAVTTPRTLWSAQCNIGQENCEAQCMEDEVKKSVKKCQEDEGNPIECFRKLKLRFRPTPMDSRKQVHWCSRKGMSTCDSFMNVPTDGGWMCYEFEDKCKEKVARGFKFEKRIREAPSVWESVR